MNKRIAVVMLHSQGLRSAVATLGLALVVALCAVDASRRDAAFLRSRAARLRHELFGETEAASQLREEGAALGDAFRAERLHSVQEARTRQAEAVLRAELERERASVAGAYEKLRDREKVFAAAAASRARESAQADARHVEGAKALAVEKQENARLRNALEAKRSLLEGAAREKARLQQQLDAQLAASLGAAQDIQRLEATLVTRQRDVEALEDCVASLEQHKKYSAHQDEVKRATLDALQRKVEVLAKARDPPCDCKKAFAGDDDGDEEIMVRFSSVE